MKNPNGFGSIIKLGGNRRKPYAVRVTVGWDKDGKQQKKYVGYCSTRKEAMELLSDYNKNPALIDNDITFKELYDKWSINKFEGLSKASIKAYKLAVKHCEPFYDLKMSTIKTDAMNELIRNIPLHYQSKKKVKNLLSQLFQYAMQNDIVSKNYAEYIMPLQKDENPVKTRTIFSKEEIEKLFDSVDYISGIDTILIMIYTGMRCGELLTLENKNINFKEGYLKVGIKTDAGKNRLIPISDKISKYIKKLYSQENEYFISGITNQHLSYNYYKRQVWDVIMKKLDMKHSPHDCRHTFATLLYQAEANQTSIKRIIGHSDYLMTEKIYTHSQIQDLKKAIDLL